MDGGLPTVPRPHQTGVSAPTWFRYVDGDDAVRARTLTAPTPTPYGRAGGDIRTYAVLAAGPWNMQTYARVPATFQAVCTTRPVWWFHMPYWLPWSPQQRITGKTLLVILSPRTVLLLNGGLVCRRVRCA